MLHQWKKEAKRKEKSGSVGNFSSRLHSYFSRFVIKRYGKLIDNEKKVFAASGKGSNTNLPPLWKAACSNAFLYVS